MGMSVPADRVAVRVELNSIRYEERLRTAITEAEKVIQEDVVDFGLPPHLEPVRLTLSSATSAASAVSSGLLLFHRLLSTLRFKLTMLTSCRKFQYFTREEEHYSCY